MPRRKKKPDLVGASEIAAMLSISRQRVLQLERDSYAPTNRIPFPRPIVRLKMGPVWLLDDVKVWAEEKGRTLTLPDEKEKAA